MHELGVTQNILAIALRHAEEAGATRITRLTLVVGELSSIVDESVQFYWDLIANGTLAEGATLEFRRVPAMLRCNDCQHEFRMDYETFLCPRCGSSRVAVSGGEEFYLESIDVDLPAPV